MRKHFHYLLLLLLLLAGCQPDKDCDCPVKELNEIKESIEQTNRSKGIELKLETELSGKAKGVIDATVKGAFSVGDKSNIYTEVRTKINNDFSEYKDQNYLFAIYKRIFCAKVRLWCRDPAYQSRLTELATNELDTMEAKLEAAFATRAPEPPQQAPVVPPVVRPVAVKYYTHQVCYSGYTSEQQGTRIKLHLPQPKVKALDEFGCAEFKIEKNYVDHYRFKSFDITLINDNSQLKTTQIYVNNIKSNQNSTVP